MNEWLIAAGFLTDGMVVGVLLGAWVGGRWYRAVQRWHVRTEALEQLDRDLDEFFGGQR